MTAPTDIRVVVLDWAGTTIDFGCLAPTGAFVAAFAGQGVAVTPAEARGPMGLHKKDHIREMLRTAAVAARWRTVRGRDWTEADVDAIYAAVTPAQVAAIGPHGALIPGLLAAVATVRSAGIKVGGTTGYFRAAAERCYAVAGQQGFTTDINVCADDVPAGRPAPWMLFRVMEAVGVYPAASVVKVGDTAADIGEARNAGAWAVGVTDTGNEMGLSAEAFAELPVADRQARREAAAGRLLAAGAQLVIRSVAELPGAISECTRRLRSGEKP